MTLDLIFQDNLHKVQSFGGALDIFQLISYNAIILALHAMDQESQNVYHARKISFLYTESVFAQQALNTSVRSILAGRILVTLAKLVLHLVHYVVMIIFAYSV